MDAIKKKESFMSLRMIKWRYSTAICFILHEEKLEAVPTFGTF